MHEPWLSVNESFTIQKATTVLIAVTVQSALVQNQIAVSAIG